MVNATPRSLYRRERPGNHCTEGWMGPRAVLDGCEKTRLHRDSIPGSSSPKRVVIPTTLFRSSLYPGSQNKCYRNYPVGSGTSGQKDGRNDTQGQQTGTAFQIYNLIHFIKEPTKDRTSLLILGTVSVPSPCKVTWFPRVSSSRADLWEPAQREPLRKYGTDLLPTELQPTALTNENATSSHSVYTFISGNVTCSGQDNTFLNVSYCYEVRPVCITPQLEVRTLTFRTTLAVIEFI
jgi:hypothetical protein